MSGICNFPIDKDGFSSVEAVLRAGADCTVPPEWRGFAFSATIHDKHGHELDGDHDPRARGGCDHRDTPEWRAERTRKDNMARKHKTQDSHTEETHSEPTEAPIPPPTEEPKPIVAAPIATVAQLPEGGLDLAKFIPAGNQSGTVAVVLGALAIGGAAVKFLPNILKARAERAKLDHEARMKELELREGRSKSDEDRDQACGKRHGELAIKVAVLEGKLGPIEARVAQAEAKAAKAEQAAHDAGGASIELDSDELDDKFEGLSKRITKLETALKKKAR